MESFFLYGISFFVDKKRFFNEVFVVTANNDYVYRIIFLYIFIVNLLSGALSV